VKAVDGVFKEFVEQFRKAKELILPQNSVQNDIIQTKHF